MDASAVNQSLNQCQQRITSLEDLLRRNEGSITSILSRMRNTEVAVSGVHKATSELIPKDIRSLAEDYNQSRRRIDTVEQSVRPAIAEAIGIFENDVRGRMSHAEERSQREVTELGKSLAAAIARERDATATSLNKLSDGLQQQYNDARIISQDAKWACENVRDLSKKHSEFANTTERRIEASEQNILLTRQQLTELINVSIERAVRDVREEMRGMMVNHQRLQGSHDDLAGAVSRLRDDTVKALSQAASNLRGLDDTTQSLETLLKAEVKARHGKVEELVDRISFCENNITMAASVSDSRLAALDDEIGQAIMEVHRAAQADTKSQLEKAWRNIHDLKDQLGRVQASQKAHAIALMNVKEAAGSQTNSPNKSPSRLANNKSPINGREGSGGGDAEDIVAAEAADGNLALSPSPLQFQTAQKRLQLQWQTDMAVLKAQLMDTFESDLAQVKQSTVLLLEQQEELSVVVHGLEKEMGSKTTANGKNKANQNASSHEESIAAFSDVFAKHDDLQQLEWKLTAMIKSASRDLVTARSEMEKRIEEVTKGNTSPSKLRAVNSKNKKKGEEEEGGDASDNDESVNSALTPGREALGHDLVASVLARSSGGETNADANALASSLKALDDRTSATFVEVDYRLQDLEDKTNTLQVLQKRLERTWNEDQEHLEACVLKLRDDLKLLASSMGIVSPPLQSPEKSPIKKTTAAAADADDAQQNQKPIRKPSTPPAAARDGYSDDDEEEGKGEDVDEKRSRSRSASSGSSHSSRSSSRRSYSDDNDGDKKDEEAAAEEDVAHHAPHAKDDAGADKDKDDGRSRSSSSSSRSSRSPSRSSRSSRSSSGSRAPVPTEDKGTGVMSGAPTPAVSPTPAAGEPKPPATPKLTTRGRKENVNATEDDMGFSPPDKDGNSGKQSSNKSKRLSNIPVVDADLNLEKNNATSEADKSRPAKKAVPTTTSTVTAPASKTSPSSNKKGGAPPVAAATPRNTTTTTNKVSPSTSSTVTPRARGGRGEGGGRAAGGVRTNKAFVPTVPEDDDAMNGSNANASLPPLNSSNAHKNGTTGSSATPQKKKAGEDDYGSPVIKGGAKSAYNHAAPGWARPTR